MALSIHIENIGKQNKTKQEQTNKKLFYRCNKDNNSTQVCFREKDIEFPHSEGVPSQWNRNTPEKEHL